MIGGLVVAGFLTGRANLLIGSGIPILFLAFCLYIARDSVNNWRGARAEHKLGAKVLLLETRRADGGPGQAAADSETGATTLGPRDQTTHGPGQQRGTRGLLPDSQEGRHGGRDSRSGEAR